jgi:ubiquinone/menaquinone biosynthesis C-methylase UbiE
MREILLEPVLRRLRLRRILPIIRRYSAENGIGKGCILLDIGCGRTFSLLQRVRPYLEHGIGIDFKVPEFNDGTIETRLCRLNNMLPFNDNKFDIVTMMAVLEHLDQPLEILSEVHRILKPGGILVGTVPSVWSKPLLEFLSFKLRIVDKAEVADHKKYYCRKSLRSIFAAANFTEISHCYFQLYMNNFFVEKCSGNTL